MLKKIISMASLAVMVSTYASAVTMVPEIDSPNACKYAIGCNRWYELSEKPEPNACKYENNCRRWYSVGNTKVMEEKITLVGINFDTGSASIRPDSFSILNENVEKLLKSNGAQIRIVGHTDNRGGDTYNQNLSEARAKSVLAYFSKKGVDASRMISEGRGESEPAVPNEGSENLFKNRRIEIYITK